MASRDTIEEAQELAKFVTNALIIERPYEKYVYVGKEMHIEMRVLYEVVEVRSCPNCGKEILTVDYGCLPYACAECSDAAKAEFEAQLKVRIHKNAEEIARMVANDEFEEPSR